MDMDREVFSMDRDVLEAVHAAARHANVKIYEDGWKDASGRNLAILAPSATAYGLFLVELGISGGEQLLASQLARRANLRYTGSQLIIFFEKVLLPREIIFDYAKVASDARDAVTGVLQEACREAGLTGFNLAGPYATLRRFVYAELAKGNHDEPRKNHGEAGPDGSEHQPRREADCAGE